MLSVELTELADAWHCTCGEEEHYTDPTTSGLLAVVLLHILHSYKEQYQPEVL